MYPNSREVYVKWEPFAHKCKITSMKRRQIEFSSKEARVNVDKRYNTYLLAGTLVKWM